MTSSFAAVRGRTKFDKNVSAKHLINDDFSRVQQMAMVLPTFVETKVGRTEGYAYHAS